MKYSLQISAIHILPVSRSYTEFRRCLVTLAVTGNQLLSLQKACECVEKVYGNCLKHEIRKKKSHKNNNNN